MDGFDYVVVKKEKPKVAFLSGQSRNLIYDKQGTTRLHCNQINMHTISKLGPGKYPRALKVTSAFYKVKSKVVSKAGVGFLASKAPRFEKLIVSCAPGPQAYNLSVNMGDVEDSCIPFGCVVPRDMGSEISDTPGIGSYDTTYRDKDHSIQMEHSFGGRVHLKQHMNIRCVPVNEDTCAVCGLKPYGDYWRKNDDTVNCRICFNKQYSKKSHIKKMYNEFKRTRDCSFMHQHEGTTATYPLMSPKEFWKQCVRENYFSSYVVPHNIKKVKPAANVGKPRCEYTKVERSKTNQLGETFKFIEDLYNESTVNALEKRNICDDELRQMYLPRSLIPEMDELREAQKYEPIKVRTTEEVELPTPKVNITDKQQIESYLLESTHTQSEELDRFIDVARKTRMSLPTYLTESFLDVRELLDCLYREYPSEVEMKPKEPLPEPEPEEEVIIKKTSELELLQDPNIPPLPRALRLGEERYSRTFLDPEIASLMSDRTDEFIETRSLSTLTIQYLNTNKK